MRKHSEVPKQWNIENRNDNSDTSYKKLCENDYGISW